MIWREGRVEEALSGLADDFEWVVPDHPEGAVRHGADGVIEFFREWMEPFDELDMDWELEETRPDSVLALDRDARARARERRAGGDAASASSGPFATAARSEWCSTTTSTRRDRAAGPIS